MGEYEKIEELFNSLIKKENTPFPQRGTAVNVSTKQGVYIIYSPKGQVLHVGTTQGGKNGLDQRLNNHRHKSSSFSKKYLIPNKIDLSDGYNFKYIEVDGRIRALLEHYAIAKLCPKHLGIGS